MAAQRHEQRNGGRHHQNGDHNDGAEKPAVGSGRGAAPSWRRPALGWLRRPPSRRGGNRRGIGRGPDAADRALHGPEGASIGSSRGRLGRVIVCHQNL